MRRTSVEPLEDRHLLSCGGVFTINSTAVNENQGNAVLTVTMSGASCGSGESATVAYSTNNGTAVAPGDYTTTNGSLTFTANGAKTVTVPINSDAVTESDEDFSVQLSNPTNGSLGTSTAGTVTIHDGTAGVSLWIEDATVSEDDTNVLLTIRTSSGTHPTITGNYSTADGTAAASADYTAVSGGSFSIPSGTAAIIITVPIKEDGDDEWDEAFQVILSNVANASVSHSSAIVTIKDDDGAAPLLTSGRRGDRDSGLNATCAVCSSSEMYYSYTESYSGSFSLYSAYLWGANGGGPQAVFNPTPTSPPPGGSPSDGCKAAQDNGQAAPTFSPDLLPQYQVSSSGLTYIETRVKIPASPSTIPTQYSVAVTLSPGDGGSSTTVAPVYFATSGTTLAVGDEIVLAVQVDAAALGLASGYYRTQTTVSAHYTGDVRTETSTGWTVIVNRQGSPYGDMWWLPGVDRLHLYNTTTATGAALVRGDGTTAWFSKSGSTFTNQTDGSFSALAQETVMVGGTPTTNYVLTTRFNEKFRFDAQGYLIERADPQGSKHTLSYDGNGLLQSVTDPFSRATTYAYASGKLDFVTNFAGQKADFTIGTSNGLANKLTAVTLDDPDPSNSSDYAPSFSLVYLPTGNGRSSGFLDTVSFDSTRVYGPTRDTSTLNLDYDATGRVEEVANPDAGDWTLASIQSKALAYLGQNKGTTSAPADIVKVANLTATHLDERNNTTLYTTDRFGNTTSIQDAEGNVTKIDRNSFGQPTVITEPDPDGEGPIVPAVTTFSYDAPAQGGHLRSITYADGSMVRYDEYDATFGIAKKFTDQLGRVTQLTVNSLGLVTYAIQVVGQTAGDSDDITTSHTYTNDTGDLPDGLLLTTTDTEGRVTEYDYFTSGAKLGWLESITYNASAQDEADKIKNYYDYDAKGNLTSITDGEGRATNLEYDQLNQLRRALAPYPNNNVAHFKTVDDVTPNPAQIDDYYHEVSPATDWNTVNGQGFGDDQRKAPTSSSTAQALWVFDNLTPGKTYEVAVTWSAANQNGANDAPFDIFDGNTSGQKLATVEVNQSIEPPVHRLFTNPNRWVILGNYTPTGGKLTVRLTTTDAQANKFVLADAVRLVEAAPTTTFDCNEQGDTLRETDAKGLTTLFNYDSMKRLVAVKVPDPAGGSGMIATTYAYDAAGNVLRAQFPDPDGTSGGLFAPFVSYTYDSLNRVKSIVSPYPNPTGGASIDDGNTDATKFATSTSGWTVNGGSRYATGSDGAAWADWKFTGLVPGKTYEVLANWAANGNNATNAQYRIYDGGSPAGSPAGTLFATQPNAIDQQVAPGTHEALRDPNDPTNTNGDNWRSLGIFTVSGEKLAVRLANTGNGRVVADGVRIVEARPTSTYVYDDVYNLQETIDALGNKTSFNYDSRHRLIERAEPDPDGTGQGADLTSPVTRYRYDAASQLLHTADPLGRTTRYVYEQYLPRVQKVLESYADPTPVALKDENEVASISGFAGAVAGGYGNDQRIAADGDAAAAQWSFSLPGNATYEVFVTWVAASTNATDTLYTVNNGANNVVHVDQTRDPVDGDLFGDLSKWHSLGEYLFTSGGTQTLTVSLAGQDGKTLVADAIRIMPKAATTTYQYYESGRTKDVTDPLGNTTEYVYDPFDRLKTVTLPDPDGTGAGQNLAPPVWEYFYDKASNTTKVKDPLARETLYAYDRLDRLIETTLPDPDGGQSQYASPVEKYEYDAVGNTVRHTDPRGVQTAYQYDRWHRLSKIVYARPQSTDTADPYVSYGYDLLSRMTSTTENVDASTTRTTAFGYDNLDQRIAATLPDPDGAGGQYTAPVYQTAYDIVGNVVQETDARGNATRYRYDHLYRLAQATLPDPDGTGSGQDQLSPFTKYTYDATSQIKTVESTLTAALVSGSAAYETETTSYAYDRAGRMTNVKLPDPTTGGPTSNSPEYLYAYDAVGNLKKATDSLGKDTDYAHDNLYRLVQRQDPDPDGATGALGRPVVAYAYDAVGNLLSLTDSKSNTTSFEYDNLDRLYREKVDLENGGGGTYADYRTYTYDASSRLTKKIDRNDRKTAYEYDEWGRLLKETWYTNEADSSANQTIEYAYNFAGDVTKAESNAGDDSSKESKLAYSYDLLGRVKDVDVEYAHPGNITGVVADFDIAYDADGYRDAFDAEIGPSGSAKFDFANDYSFDALGRMVMLSQSAQGSGTNYHKVAEKRADFAYRADGQFSRITRYKDTDGGSANDVVLTSFSYDKLGRLAELKHEDVAESGAAVERSKFNWTYDKFNQLLTSQERFNANSSLNRDITYTYDHTHQLKSMLVDVPSPGTDVTTDYTYDENGNRTGSGSYQNDADNYNRVISNPDYTYTYDDEGNMTSRKRKTLTGGSDDRVDFEWDHRNRLVKLSQMASTPENDPGDPDGDPNYDWTAAVTVDYAYDAFDRRILKARDVAPASSGTYSNATDVSQYMLDGEDIVLSFDRDGALTNRYLHGPAVDQILADEQYTGGQTPSGGSGVAGTVYWAITDNLGSVRQLVDNNGEEVKRINYDAFGQMTVASGTIDHIFGYTGRDHDAESHLQFNRARYYDPQLGRFISEDPLGFGGGDENLYRYVGNGSTNATDPSGWEAFELFKKKYYWPWEEEASLNPLDSVVGDAARGVGEAVIEVAPKLVEQSAEMMSPGLGLYKGYERAKDAYDYATDVYDKMRYGRHDEADSAATAVVATFFDKVLGVAEFGFLYYGEYLYQDKDGKLDADKYCTETGFRAVGRIAVQISLAILFERIIARGKTLGRRSSKPAAAPEPAPIAPEAKPTGGGSSADTGIHGEVPGTGSADTGVHGEVPGTGSADIGVYPETGANATPSKKAGGPWLDGRYTKPASQKGAYWDNNKRVFPTQRNSGLSGKALRDEQRTFFENGLREGKMDGVLRGQAAEAGYERRGGIGGNDRLADRGAEQALQDAKSAVGK